jgi:6-phosphogluconolactonase
MQAKHYVLDERHIEATGDPSKESERKMYSLRAIQNKLIVGVAMFISVFSLNVQALVNDAGNTTIPERAYVLSNLGTDNTVIVYDRADDGALTFLQEVSTGGFGSGPGELPPPLPPFPGPIPLDSQDALIKTQDGRFLIAVNAGSNDISVLAITPAGLTLVDKVPSNGSFPVSVTEHGGLVYVANAGQTPDEFPGAVPVIAGFRLNADGKLHPIPGSRRVAGPANASAADIVFSPNGQVLVMTELNGNAVDVFRMGTDGRPVDEIRMPANSLTPFGAQFTRGNILAIVETNDTSRRLAVDKGTSMSSYRLADDGTLVPVSKAVLSGETAACWIRFTPDGQFAFAINAGSGSISTFRLADDGSLSLVSAVTVDTGGPFSLPIDSDITADGKFLYVAAALDGLNGVPRIPLPLNVANIQVYRIGVDGSLTLVSKTTGVPFTTEGVVAH